MAAFFSLLALAGIVPLTFCLPSPQTHEAKASQRGFEVNCTDLAAIPDPSCWATLDLSAYVANWNKLTPKCDADGHDDARTCCFDSEPWQVCFMRLGAGNKGYDCTTIGDKACPSSGIELASELAPSIRPKVAYILRTFKNLNAYFTVMSRVIATQPVDNSHLYDILKIDPKSQTFDNTERTIALSLGPAFLGKLSAAETPAVFDSSVYTVSNLTAHSLAEAPAVSKAMWSEIKANQSIAEIYQRGLSQLMTDYPSFLSFCATGGWSAELDTSFSAHYAQESALVSSAFVYETSKTLQQDGWYAVPALVSDISTSLGSEGCSALNTSGVICTDPHGLTTFQSGVTGRVYTFKYQGKGRAPLTPASLLQELNTHLGQAFLFDGYTNLAPAFFDGGYNCTLNGAAGALRPFQPDGSIDTSCLSVLPMYLPKGSACPSDAVLVGEGKCPFGFEG